MVPNLFDLFINTLALAVIMAFYGDAPTWRALFLPVPIFLAAIIALGFGMWFAAAAQNIAIFVNYLRFLLQGLHLLSPLGYSSHILSDRLGIWVFLYYMNPLVGVIDLTRWCVLPQGAAELPHPGMLAVSLGFGLALILRANGILGVANGPLPMLSNAHSNMPDDVAVIVNGLTKSYINGRVGVVDTSLREQFTAFLKPWRLINRGKRGVIKEPIQALSPISFEIPKGQKLGILGRNGSGKSTLLKLLARITEPSAGHAMIRGRVASILEVGTGFHPELTGAENVFLNGAILGLKREFLMSRMESIVKFAELDEYMSLPVKRYSSGMYVRLAFAVAAHIDSDVLLIDEVLAVGDEGFREKCISKLEDEAAKGRTVVLVSHDMKAVERFCDRVIHIHKGQLDFDGDVTEAIARYEELCREANQSADKPA